VGAIEEEPRLRKPLKQMTPNLSIRIAPFQGKRRLAHNENRLLPVTTYLMQVHGHTSRKQELPVSLKGRYIVQVPEGPPATLFACAVVAPKHP
jgi:hypothetical protein